MKITLLHLFWKPIYPYLVIGKVAVLLAMGLVVIHLNELSRWLSKGPEDTTENAMKYVNRIN